jgi:succinate dehydrogenase flavin-adding protein (antitoxin of CptAB toxin-antitoxin module)
MITAKISTSMAARPLFIDFDSYTDGDNDFKKELTELMIDNLRELCQVLKQSDTDLFHKVCHKVKATVVMLDDTELMQLMDDLKVSYNDSDRKELLDKICLAVIDSLNKEL